MRKMHDNIRLYHADHLGSTSLVTDIDGEITQHVAYIPYGEVFVEQRNGSWNTPYLFNAKELDEETGLYYYGARYLDPTHATWLSVDPLFEKYVGMTPYGYCAGNPVGLVDPDGMQNEEVSNTWSNVLNGLSFLLATPKAEEESKKPAETTDNATSRQSANSASNQANGSASSKTTNATSGQTKVTNANKNPKGSSNRPIKDPSEIKKLLKNQNKTSSAQASKTISSATTTMSESANMISVTSVSTGGKLVKWCTRGGYGVTSVQALGVLYNYYEDGFTAENVYQTISTGVGATGFAGASASMTVEWYKQAGEWICTKVSEFGLL